MATPGNPQATSLSEAKAGLVRKDYHRAIEKATEVIVAAPREATAYLVRAEALRRLGKPERALADLAVAIRLEPDRPSPYVVRAEILKRRCEFDRAIADASQAISLDPGNAAAYSIRASCRESIGDPEGAASDHEESVRIDPTRPPSRLTSRSDAPDLVPAVRSRPAIPDDDRHVFADGKMPDRSYRSRPPMTGDDAAEVLGEASGYKPGVLPVARARSRSGKNSPAKRLGYGVLLIGIGVVAACLVMMRQSSPPAPDRGPGILQAKAPVPAARTDEVPRDARVTSEDKAGGTGQKDIILAEAAGGPPRQEPAPAPAVGRKPTGIQVRQVRVTLDEAGDCRLLIDTRGEVPPAEPQQGTPSTIAGLSNAKVTLEEDGTHRVVYSFAEVGSTADFAALNGSPVPTGGISIDRAAGALLMTPLPEPKGPGKRASVSFPRYLKAPVAATIDFEKFDNYTVFLSLWFPEGVLQVRVSPRHPGWQQEGSRMGVTFTPIANNKSGKPSVLLEGRLEQDKLADYALHVPADASVLKQRCKLDFFLQGQEAASIARLDVRGRVTPSFGIALGPDKGGVKVQAVIRGGASEKAGLKAGDVIVSIGGEKVSGGVGAVNMLSDLAAGKEVPFVVKRANQEKTIMVKGE